MTTVQCPDPGPSQRRDTEPLCPGPRPYDGHEVTLLPATADPTAPPESWRLLVRYSVALCLYVALGLALKVVVLNWIIGPLFPLVALELVPRATRRVRRQR